MMLVAVCPPCSFQPQEDQKKAGEWACAPETYHDIEAWNALGENADDSLYKAGP